MPLTDEQQVSAFSISPDNQRVLFTVTRYVPTINDPFGVDLHFFHELFSGPIDGSAPATRLSTNIGSEQSIASYLPTPDGQFVVYGKSAHGGATGINIHDNPIDHELFAVPIGGGTPQLVNDAFAPGMAVASFQPTADSSTIVYQATGNGRTVGLFAATIPVPEPSACGLTCTAWLLLVVIRRHGGSRQTPVRED